MPEKVPTEQVVAAYKATGSVWKAAKQLGLCGQSVWERLKFLGHKLPGRRWTAEEHAELENLVATCSISEISRRLGRPYGSVATKISERGLARRCRSTKKKVSLRGTGLNKATTATYATKLRSFSGTLTQFCRQNGLSVDMVVAAFQKYQPNFWAEFAKDNGKLGESTCAYCSATYYPQNHLQRTCSRKCQAYLRSDKKYFNGNRKSTIGLAEGVCQVCLQQRPSLSSHHVWGKENDEAAEFLVAVCAGCHHLIGRLATRKVSGDAGFFERLIIFANMRRHGAQRPVGFHCQVDIEELSQQEIEDDTW